MQKHVRSPFRNLCLAARVLVMSPPCSAARSPVQCIVLVVQLPHGHAALHRMQGSSISTLLILRSFFAYAR
jgi:hypothetical protein